MSIIFPPNVIYWAVTGLSLQTAWSWLMLVALSLLAPLVSVEARVPVVITPLPSSPIQAGAGPQTLVTNISLLGGSEQTLSQPRRLGSLARPLEVLVLDSEGLRHVLAPESVSALLVILPPHPQSLDATHLPGLGQAPTCCASQVKDWRRVRSEEIKIWSHVYYFLDVVKWLMSTDLSVSGVRVPSMSEWAIIASYTADQSERHYKSKVNADGFSWISFNKTLIEILQNWILFEMFVQFSYFVILNICRNFCYKTNYKSRTRKCFWFSRFILHYYWLDIGYMYIGIHLLDHKKIFISY